MSLDGAAARAAIAALAERLGATPARTAHAIVTIADAEMARALRRVSVERGIDPRSCALVAFGGGGPLHACALADLLGDAHVLVPPFAGVLSALGLAIAPERREAATSIMRVTSALQPGAFAARLDAIGREARGAMTSARLAWTARIRYAGQGHELDVPCMPQDDGDSLRERFTELHAGRYGFTLDSARGGRGGAGGGDRGSDCGALRCCA